MAAQDAELEKRVMELEQTVFDEMSKKVAATEVRSVLEVMALTCEMLPQQTSQVLMKMSLFSDEQLHTFIVKDLLFKWSKKNANRDSFVERIAFYCSHISDALREFERDKDACVKHAPHLGQRGVMKPMFHAYMRVQDPQADAWRCAKMEPLRNLLPGNMQTGPTGGCVPKLEFLLTRAYFQQQGIWRLLSIVDQVRVGDSTERKQEKTRLMIIIAMLAQLVAQGAANWFTVAIETLNRLIKTINMAGLSLERLSLEDDVKAVESAGVRIVYQQGARKRTLTLQAGAFRMVVLRDIQQRCLHDSEAVAGLLELAHSPPKMSRNNTPEKPGEAQFLPCCNDGELVA